MEKNQQKDMVNKQLDDNLQEQLQKKNLIIDLMSPHVVWQVVNLFF